MALPPAGHSSLEAEVGPAGASLQEVLVLHKLSPRVQQRLLTVAKQPTQPATSAPAG